MNIDRILHIRAVKGYDINSRPRYETSVRGVTVVGSLVWNEEAERTDIVFAWAIQCPQDQYNKKEGIRVATKRLNEGLIIQTNYENRFPLKYQFFNAVANAREYYHSTPDSNKETQDFLDLSFFSLATIAEISDWFTDVRSSQLPSIHPDILINYIHRMNKHQMRLTGLADLIGKSPMLTDMVNLSYGVKL